MVETLQEATAGNLINHKSFHFLGQVCVDKSKKRFYTSVLPSPTPVDMPAKRTVEPSKPKAPKMRSYNIEKDSTCIGQEDALNGERYN